MKKEKKFEVLAKIAVEFNKNNIVWAVGASMLLYFKGIIKEFNDIDIMIKEEDAKKAKEILNNMGELIQKSPTQQYKTKVFLEYVVDEVDIDVMAGFVIVNNDKDHYFPLKKEDISEMIVVNGQNIPLHSVSEWQKYYLLMNKMSRVKEINDFKNEK